MQAEEGACGREDAQLPHSERCGHQAGHRGGKSQVQGSGRQGILQGGPADESPSYLVEAILCGSHVFFRHKTILLLDVTTGPGFENTNGLIYTSYCTQIVMVSFSDAVAASHYNMPVGVPHCICSSFKCRTLTAEEFTKAPQMKLGDMMVCRRCSPAMCHPATGCSCRSKWAPLTASLAFLTSSWTASMTARTMMAGSTRWEPCGS